MNIDQNNGAIHIYLKIYILGTIGILGINSGAKIFYPTMRLLRQGIILTENYYAHHVQRSEKYPDANF